MIAIANFIIAFIMSFAGSIPPGTINLTVIQLGLEHKVKTAIRFSVAAALMEYPYAWIAVKFEKLITSSPAVTENLGLLTAIVLICLGAISLWPRKESGPEQYSGFAKGGFRKGLILGILNPLAVPYWVGITAYLRSQEWIVLSPAVNLHAYLSGVVGGGFAFLLLLAYLSQKTMQSFAQFLWIRKLPGLLLVVLGFYALYDYFF